MRELMVVGLSEDGERLVLRAGEEPDAEAFELGLADVRRAERAAAPAPPPGEDGPRPPSPREIQQRIRRGESAAQIAESSGMDPRAVERYEGPVLAERHHQARAARRATVDGRVVGELVADHLGRVGEDPEQAEWDCWLTDSGRWEVRVRAGREVVRLAWDAASRRVHALDETARSALLLAPAAQDALGAVLRQSAAARRGARPVAVPAPESSSGPAPVPASATPRRGRAAVPAWDDIATSVSGPRPVPDPGEGAPGG